MIDSGGKILSYQECEQIEAAIFPHTIDLVPADWGVLQSFESYEGVIVKIQHLL